MIKTYKTSQINFTKSNSKIQMYDESDRPDRRKRGISIYLRILMNYFQSIGLIHNLGLKWPYYVRNFLGFYSNAGSISRKTISIDCILNDYNINVKSIYVQTSFSIMLPFLSYLIALLILVVQYLFGNRKIKRLITQFIVIIIVSSIFLQPNNIESLFENLVCKNLDQKDYLLSDMSIDCNEKNHKKW